MVASNNGLAAILWENDNLKRFLFAKLEENKTNLILLKWEKQLREYFARKRKSFDIDLDFTGSDFQKKVWQVLLTIPFGETRSYTQIATQIGNPKASRAVGAAIGKNPIGNYCALSSRYWFIRKINRFFWWIRGEGFFVGAGKWWLSIALTPHPPPITISNDFTNS